MRYSNPAKIFFLLLLALYSCQKANQKLYSDIQLSPTHRKGSFASKKTIEGLLYEIWNSGFIRKNDLTKGEILNNAYGVFRKAPKTLSDQEGRAYYHKREGKKDLLMLNAGLFGHLEPAPKLPHLKKVRIKRLDKGIRATLVHELFHDFWHNILDSRKKYLFASEVEIFFIELMLSKTEQDKLRFLDKSGLDTQDAVDFESFGVLLEIHDIYIPEKFGTELYAILASRAYTGESIIPKQLGKYYSVLVSDEALDTDRFISSADSGQKGINHQTEIPGHLATIKKAVEDRPEILKANDRYGFTLLHQAAFSGNLDVVRFLIAKGADTEAKAFPYAWTPVFLASLKGHPGIAEELIKSGVRIDAKDRRGRSPLHLAAQKGHKELVELLLRHGMDIISKDAVGMTPLHMAALCGRLDTAAFLIAKGANTKAKDFAGQTPLHQASFGGDKNTVELLIAEGAEVDERDNKGETALHLAAFCGHEKIVGLLIERGAEPRIENIHGETPLDIASLAGHEKIVDILRRAAY